MNNLIKKGSCNQSEESLPPSFLVVTFVIGIVGSSSFLFAPFWVGGLINQSGWPPSDAGLLISVELAAAALGSLSIMLGQIRHFMVVGLICLALANMGTAWELSISASDIDKIISLRILAGLGGGIALASTYIGLSSVRNPDPYFAMFLSATLFISGIGLYLFPLLMEQFKIVGLYAGWAVICLIILFLSIHVMKAQPHLSQDVSRDGALKKTLAILAALFLLFSSQGAIWTFLEPLASGAEISSERFGLILAFASICGFLGGVVNAAQRDRLGRKWPVASALLATLALIIALSPPINERSLVISVCGLQFLWCYAIPFLMGGLAECLSDRRGLAAGVFVQLAGLGLGPFVVSVLIKLGSNIGSVIWVAAGFTLLTLLMTITSLPQPERRLLESN